MRLQVSHKLGVQNQHEANTPGKPWITVDQPPLKNDYIGLQGNDSPLYSFSLLFQSTCTHAPYHYRSLFAHLI